jgi:mono/diheme cytochrome c family protein
MRPVFKIGLLGLGIMAMSLANSFGGERLPAGSPGPAVVGRTLFLKNCAHGHADDATGDEGPDLHRLKRGDDWIARRIRNGIKGEMTAFGEKFSQADIDSIIAYLRTLK